MFFGFGHGLWSQGLRRAGNHARAPVEATPQSACSAGKQSRSATLSTPGGWRGRNMGSGPDIDMMGAAHAIRDEYGRKLENRVVSG